MRSVKRRTTVTNTTTAIPARQRDYRQGRVLRESSGTTDEAEARRLLKKRSAQVTTGTHPGLQIERVKVDELAEAFFRYYKINGHTSLDDVENPLAAAPRTVLQRDAGGTAHQQPPGAVH